MNKGKLYCMTGIFCLILIFGGVLPSRKVRASENFNSNPTVTIPEEKSYSVTGAYTWIKYKAPGNGYITVRASSILPKNTVSYTDNTVTIQDPATGQQSTLPRVYSQGKWRLYSAKKNTALSSDDIFRTASSQSMDTTQTYGVKKNTTYYLRVSSNGNLTIKCKFTKVSENSGSQKIQGEICEKE